MLRRVTWRSWATLAAALTADVVLGFWLSGNGTVEEDLYRWGLTVLTFAPAVLVAAYAASGHKFWRTDVGSAFVWLAGAITWLAWPLAYTFWVLHGILGPSWLAWIEVSGPALVALSVLWLCFVFLRGDRDERNVTSGGGKAGA